MKLGMAKLAGLYPSPFPWPRLRAGYGIPTRQARWRDTRILRAATAENEEVAYRFRHQQAIIRTHAAAPTPDKRANRPCGFQVSDYGTYQELTTVSEP
jgi:hypothetical protein